MAETEQIQMGLSGDYGDDPLERLAYRSDAIVASQ
jgi:hypothetical protein